MEIMKYLIAYEVVGGIETTKNSSESLFIFDSLKECEDEIDQINKDTDKEGMERLGYFSISLFEWLQKIPTEDLMEIFIGIHEQSN